MHVNIRGPATSVSPIQNKIIKRVSALMKLEEKGILFHENECIHTDLCSKATRKRTHIGTEWCFRFDQERHYYAWVYKKSNLPNPREDYIEVDDYYVDIW